MRALRHYTVAALLCLAAALPGARAQSEAPQVVTESPAEDYESIVEQRAEEVDEAGDTTDWGDWIDVDDSYTPAFDDSDAFDNADDPGPPPELISDSAWSAIAAGRDYPRDEREAEPEEGRDGATGFDFGAGFLDGISTLAWVVIALAILALLGLLLRARRDTSVTERGRGFGLTDELLSASRAELDDGLARELGDGDYRAAIRFRFGQLLQDLRAARLLRWVPGKTNAEYVAELPERLQADFGGLADGFDFAYYSGQPVMRQRFDTFAADAERFAAAAQVPLPQNGRS